MPDRTDKEFRADGAVGKRQNDEVPLRAQQENMGRIAHVWTNKMV